MQQRALRLMASKLSAATVIEGNISEEGLAAMSDCEDLTTQLARELVTGLKDNIDDLSASFRKMAILGNRQTETQAEHKNVTISQASAPKKTTSNAPNSDWDVVIKQFNAPNPKPVGKTTDTGQLSIFDLLAS